MRSRDAELEYIAAIGTVGGILVVLHSVNRTVIRYV